MTTISERYDRLHLRVTSRDEQIVAELLGRFEVRLTVLSGLAPRIGHQELESRLAGVSRLLFAHRAAAMARMDRELLLAAPAPAHPGDDEFERAYRMLHGRGRSHDDLVEASIIGGEQFAWDLRPEVTGLSAPTLSADLTEAANGAVEDFAGRLGELRHRLYTDH